MDYTISDQWCIGPKAISLGFGKYCCKECGKDLDKNGLFPGEEGYGENNE